MHWSFAVGRDGRFRAAAADAGDRPQPVGHGAAHDDLAPGGPLPVSGLLLAPRRAALLNPRRPPGCAGGATTAAPRFPRAFRPRAAVSRAAGYLAGRAGRDAFAVIDTEGRLSGVDVHARFTTASVVKAMLLVAYLRRLDARGQRHVDPYSASFLYPMIHVSDNNAATTCQSYVGDAGLYAVARAAGMTDFSVVGLLAHRPAQPRRSGALLL